MIKSSQLLFASAVAAAMLASSVSQAATVIGSSATGGLFFSGGSTNWFDAANGFVPAGFSNKTQGTTVTVVNPGTEFGFNDTANLDTVDITASQIIISDTVLNSGEMLPFKSL